MQQRNERAIIVIIFLLMHFVELKQILSRTKNYANFLLKNFFYIWFIPCIILIVNLIQLSKKSN